MRTFAADLYLLVAAYGLALPVSYAGLPVLGQGAFVAVGAFGTALLATHGTPLLVAVAASVAIAAGAGYGIGFAARRLAGASLALATWGIAWVGYVALVQFPSLSGGSQGLLLASPARLVSPSLGVTLTLDPWVHVAAALVVDIALAYVLHRAATTAWGIDWAALRTGPSVADSLGVPVQRRRRALLASAAAIGALGGAGGAILAGVVAPVDYSPLLSLQLFVAVVIGGTGRWWGPPLGVAVIAVLPSSADALASAASIDAVRARSALTAVLLVAALVLRRPVGRVVDRVVRTAPRPGTDQELEPARLAAPAAGPVLRLAGVSARYGAVLALDGVDLEVNAGEIHALIGPNGSGKTTALRVAAGVVTPDAGAVEITGRPAPPPGDAAPRARAGLVRTFQHPALLGELAVKDQVAIGTRVREQAPYLGMRELFSTPQGHAVREQRRHVIAEALAAAGLAGEGALPAQKLDSARQRLLQIARAMATGAGALLLDEPAAGMSRAQREELVTVLLRLRGLGYGVLLVEHDIGLVNRVADRVTVLAGGTVIASGSPDEVQRDPEVRRAYLGEVPAASPAARR